MSKESEKAVYYFNNGYCCAESVLLSIAESKGIESPLIPKIATGFCGGMSHTDGTCGALTGGILAISMVNGRAQTSDDRNLPETQVQHLVALFKEKYATTQCYKLTGCDLGTDEGQEQFVNEGMKSLCDSLVDFVTDKTMELLAKTK